MEGRIQDAMTCSEFETLLSDALDGTLAAEALARFEGHKRACAVCRLMFTEVETGMNALQAMPEVEPPAHLVRNILAETSGFQPVRMPETAGQGWIGRLREWARPVIEPAMQPRFAMSAATAFFSVTLVLNVAGFRVGNVRAADLRPSTVIAGISQFAGETQGRVVKYYENLRFVYEIESRVRQLKNATDDTAQPSEPQKDKKQKDDNTSGQPQRHEERYSLGFGEGILASVAAPWTSDGALAVLDRRNP